MDTDRRSGNPAAVSVFVWAMMGIGLWHFAVFLPDRFWGGTAGAFAAALAGSLVSGYLLPEPGLPTDNPPGVAQAFWAVPGALLGMATAYWYGARRQA
jgi:hypothetical protein